MTETAFEESVRTILLPLLSAHGFHVTEQSATVVRLAAPSMNAIVSFDPRGELDVDIIRADHPDDRWSYVGLLGRANLARLCELAADELQADPRILLGDPEDFRQHREALSAHPRLP